MSTAIAFIDAGFLTATLQRNSPTPTRIRTDSRHLVKLMAQIATRHGSNLLRTYWYDAQWDPGDARFADRQKFLDALALREGLQLRMGRLQENHASLPVPLTRALSSMGVDLEELRKRTTGLKETQQKGVDTLLVLDLVALAQNHAYDVAIVFAGDSDFVEAARLAGAAGRRVILVVPPMSYNSASVALCRVADEVVRLTEEDIRALEFVKDVPVDHDTTASAAAAFVAPLPGPRPATLTPAGIGAA